MICYRDRAFCSCDNPECPRYLSEEDQQRAAELELPIAFAYFHEEKDNDKEN